MNAPSPRAPLSLDRRNQRVGATTLFAAEDDGKDAAKDTSKSVALAPPPDTAPLRL
jgi:hypothetical protein